MTSTPRVDDQASFLRDRSPRDTPRAPSRLWTLTEGRAVFELGAFYAARRRLLDTLPKGDGHAVIVLPGFLASNRSTAPLRGFLRDLGYDAHGWASGRNLKVDNALIARLEDQLAQLNEASARKVSLVGWSLGGTLARELAKRNPARVRSVISLGSPIKDDRRYTNARHLFEWINGEQPEPMRDGKFSSLEEAPPVPTTSVYSRTDGIVHWRGSIQHQTPTPSENIEVLASHLGLGVNPSVMVLIADRLAQEEGAWRPFTPSPRHQWMFPASDAK